MSRCGSTARTAERRGPGGAATRVIARYNRGRHDAVVAFPVSGFDYTYTLPPPAAVTLATWPAT
ncbi:MAG: hypothetical protein ACR2F6_18665 [Mycobacteriales bacterium]